MTPAVGFNGIADIIWGAAMRMTNDRSKDGRRLRGTGARWKKIVWTAIIIVGANKDKLYCIGLMTAERSKKRLDKFLTEQELVSSRERAQELIREGKVEVNGRNISKSSLSVTSEDEIKLQEQESPWVSRGALKLEKALDHWKIEVSNKKCLDVGACTGGVSQVLLSRGARKVYALDVGKEQLAKKLKDDPKIINLEKINARDIPEEAVPEYVDMIVVDVSYISLTLILPEIVKFLAPQGEIIALIKPQFEVGRKKVKKGVVASARDRKQAGEKIKEKGKELGLNTFDIIESPILGEKGNREFLLRLTK